MSAARFHAGTKRSALHHVAPSPKRHRMANVAPARDNGSGALGYMIPPAPIPPWFDGADADSLVRALHQVWCGRHARSTGTLLRGDRCYAAWIDYVVEVDSLVVDAFDETDARLEELGDLLFAVVDALEAAAAARDAYGRRQSA